MERKEQERRALVDALLRKAHEQSLAAPERSPFWREGNVRCELHRGAEQDRLKVFRGDRCVHEEVVPPGPQAHSRCDELRRVLIPDAAQRRDPRRRRGAPE